MTDFELEPGTVEAHQRALSTVAATVCTAGAAATKRVGGMDFGALFASTLVPDVNRTLDDVRDAITRHKAEVEQHRADFLRNIQADTDTDSGGASAITGSAGS
ncbi:hypothetical protein [Tsukamurella sp. 1534]|uniref:hypothetical protein n=1 Tax=Tsukamurella sp. 1534 TaxID=1151061 RepID=UPI0002F96556|nr:hypothetical protein [Tsukamurella sp. 1534]